MIRFASATSLSYLALPTGDFPGRGGSLWDEVMFSRRAYSFLGSKLRSSVGSFPFSLVRVFCRAVIVSATILFVMRSV